MEDYTRKCKRIAGIAVMEVDHGGVRNGAVDAGTSAGSSKRMKVDDSKNFEPSSSSSACLGNRGHLVNSPEKSLFPPATSENSDREVIPHGDSCSSSGSDRVLASRCYGGECLGSVDLEANGFETENPTYINSKFSRETTPLSEPCKDWDEMESAAKKSTVSQRRKPPAGKMPSTVEIEEFFSVAEKYEQKRFAEKYNYDIVKDVPMEGRYQWVRLKP
ncbi:hypothetical protein L1049_015397 [Liquidambar formosana]|uniref:Cyclin-dependent kinase inhibitor n=1 Tax=Liquidambar formosana TaxID=63359 RepID=A0AAP0WZQ5_LIQFO